ncbi:hypothetical protein BHE74_00020983 [Ensete ventricosum]|uniref:Uncharacterized protein n=1 Tax=Ensete ventricosum TaxID=4639 RepID=A0A426XQ20_ENSVE|nr:hypothetical protein B296_00050881 [Ensete ventricosum]RWW19568.1 hypothetical protein GW17_00016364 [Ensete ventricosum]RWW71306.1 hypothetical protein BHE74_00020983 [Ensete ventricosum]RZR92518.1 hypothetical protein BHM03_00020830 [Ensete ventricosum]
MEAAMKALSKASRDLLHLVQHKLDQDSPRSYPDDVSRQSKTLKIKIDYLLFATWVKVAPVSVKLAPIKEEVKVSLHRKV